MCGYVISFCLDFLLSAFFFSFLGIFSDLGFHMKRSLA